MILVTRIKNTPTITLRFSILAFLLLPIRNVFSECSPMQWMCDNQETCIDADEKCDGHIDCPDGSDEIAMNCFNATKCPDFSFKCHYGACISGRRSCDGKRDCGDGSDELLCKTNAILSNIQGECRNSDEIQCLTSKECIDRFDLCDGRVQCSDGTDESVELCGRDMCPTGFRCAYGACVSGHALCNGTAECHDGSDEAWENCGYQRKFPSKDLTFATRINEKSTNNGFPNNTDMSMEGGLPCKIPENLSALEIKLRYSDVPLLPGTYVDDDETIKTKCKNKSDIGTDLFCSNGVWNRGFPACIVYCDKSILKGISTQYYCHQNGISEESFCHPSVLPNTSITVYCNSGYMRTLSRPQELQCFADGKFNEKRLPCEQNCGQLTFSARSLTKGAFPIKPSKAPWHVAIFRNDAGVQSHICGGSIISPRLIISAAHCFWNMTVPTSPHLYRIIAGKQNNTYVSDKAIEGSPQDLEVERIYISKDYNDLENYFYADIAILKLKTPLIYNENVSALCMHTRAGDVQDYVKSNVTGSITGYGRTGILERLNMRTVSYEECHQLSDGSTLASDKFCLRNDNIHSTLCRGDSGGGYVEHRNGSFYLLGIVSYSTATQVDCVTAKFVGMSNVRYMRPDLYDRWQLEVINDRELF